jgi:GNAT superfamily N-acetyltransferase
MADASGGLMHLIEKIQYQNVRALFHPLEDFQPMCTAVLEGIWPGKVWVDASAKPGSAMMVTFLSGGGAAWGFLAGKPDNPEFTTAVNQVIFEEKIVGQDVGAFLFTCASGDWGEHLSVVGHPRQPAPMMRRHYVCRELAFDWKTQIPGGFRVIPLKIGLLKDKDLQIPNEVKTTLEKWMSIKDDRFRDFGFAAVHENQIVSWATVDFITANSADLGFETLPEFRRRGLGSMVAAAALECGLELGIEIHWTCAEDNIESQRIAENLGLDRGRDYTMYLFMLDLHNHMAQLAYSKLAKGEHRDAIVIYEDLFAQKTDVPTWAYFDTAQAWAALGDGENALKYLRLAAKSGWSAVDLVEKSEEFRILHDTPEWGEVIQRMQQNQEE